MIDLRNVLLLVATRVQYPDWTTSCNV